jgi:hypothetical protein
MTVLEPFEAAFSFTPVAKEERIVCEEEEEEEEERSRVGDEERGNRWRRS